MHKAIGLITCASVMAVSLYLFSGGDASRTLSAQTDSASGDSYGSVARRFMQDARKAAQEGNTDEARRIAEAANALSTTWGPDEQTPAQFLKSLDSKPASDAGSIAWDDIEADSEPAASENPFAAAAAQQALTKEEQPATSNDLLRKKQAQRFITEARQALAAGDFALARSRVLQAKQLNESWGLWDDRPEHVLADIDKADSSKTFLAGSNTAAPEKSHSADYQKAASLLQQARLAMSAASTELAALRLLHQYNGALAAELYKTLAAIDDEDLLTAQQLVRELSRREPLGLHLVTPWQIVLAGPPNVGKSSLINALLGYERSLVYDQPGTTRDVVQANTAIRGWPVTLTDTAGLRHAAESLESIGIKHAQQQIAGADLVLNVIDVHTSAEAVTEYQRQWPASILVVNKSDLPRATERVSDLTAAETSRRVIATSTLCGSGIDELMEAIAAVLIGDELPLACALPFLSEHYRVLAETSTLLAAEDSTAAKLMLRSLL